ncbi:hypothetical protein Pint_33716 [Pistacia integerrima]|uniref:Uncharacterized protein n=1 Tax=Pistacia integerrima TaxID=434235 RepID=A0ACC0X9D3_9ROSI|nr:hypothetical protein Pint_33716 [Pistacia integerrima]
MTEVVEDIVIVGAGIAGLTTSLGFHRSQGSQFYYGLMLGRLWMLLELLTLFANKDQLIDRIAACLYNTRGSPFREITKDQRKIVLIGCDGANLVVAKWLGFKKPAFSGRSGMRDGELEDNPKKDEAIYVETEDRKIGAFDAAGDRRGAVEVAELVEEGGLEGKCKGGGDLCYPQEHVAGGRGGDCCNRSTP